MGWFGDILKKTRLFGISLRHLWASFIFRQQTLYLFPNFTFKLYLPSTHCLLQYIFTSLCIYCLPASLFKNTSPALHQLPFYHNIHIILIWYDMDPPIINEASFGAANPAAYSLAEIWPTFGMSGLRMDDVSIADSSSVTDEEQQSSYSMLLMGGGSGSGSGTSKKKRRDGNTLDDILKNTGKHTKISGSGEGNGGSKTEMDANLEAGNELGEQSTRPTELPKQDYIHVRARRGQATDSHSLAERARREKISERMKILQDLVPGCNKVIGKALVLDEIINYIQSLQRQVEFLSMKLEAVNPRMGSPTDGFSVRDLGAPAFDAAGILFGSQPAREYMQATQAEWLHMQLGSPFDRPT